MVANFYRSHSRHSLYASSGYLRKLHTTASSVDRSHRLGACGVTGCKSYLLHPAKSPLTTTTTTTTSQGRRLRAKSEQPTAPLRGGLLENLPTIQRRVFATALKGKTGRKGQKQPQQRPKTAPRTTRTSPSMAPNHPRALRDQISQRENGLSHLMRAGRERKKERKKKRSLKGMYKGIAQLKQLEEKISRD